MEAIHGVDASWLHRPRGNSPAPAPPMKVQSGPQTTEVIREVPKPERRQEIDPKPERRQEASVPASAQTPPKKSRPGLLGRASTDKRSSWMSNLSSKFSSSQSQQTGPSPTSAAVSKAQSIPLPASPSAKSMNGYFPTTIANNAQKDTSEEAIDDEYSPYIPQQPKAGGSFFSSALRRISTNNPARPQVGTGQGGVRPRKTLNVDTVRDRCAVKELEQLNLRRVSFRVDVELLGGSKYAAEGEPTERKKKIKDKKLKERAEGNALRKTSISLLETESDSDDVIQTAGAKLGSPPPNKVSWADDSKGDAAKTAEQKRPVQQGTLTNNGNPEKVSAPVDIVSNTSNTPAPDPRKLSLEGPPLKSDDKPTTDPLRVYRRCCQLREAPVLKRISEQLSNPNVYATESPGVVNCLNLNSSRMQAADIVCLGDWLAIVPVKKLQLEDANLTDEGLRVILAGLLAAKHPEILKRKRAKSSPNQPREFLRQATGIVEKLSLKNNKRITAEGWMHICLFLNMSRSIKAIDLSMIPFPQLPTVNAQEQSTRARSNSNSGVRDTAEIFRKSLAERLAGNCLEELLLAECGLSTYQLGKIIDYASTGIPILGLASNHLDHAGFAHVGRYLRSGICKGLDLGGNDLHMKMESISTNLAELRTRSHNLLWALSFANCNLTADDLEQLFPALVELPDFRLLDLSHNRGLFAGSGPTALGVLRRYLPKLPLLKRISLGDTSLTAPQAIGLADIIPECRNLIHVSLLDNPELRKVLVEAVDVAAQEEACAVYASMMTAVRLSKTLLCMDIDVPSPNASEVVKALARQVVAYLLTNIERYSEYDAIKVADAAALLPDISEVEKTAARPEILQHFLEHHEHPELHTGKTPAADEDYFVGGTGVVKALSYCLNASQLKRNSVQPETSTELLESEAGKATAKEMSKTLLESARKWRNSLQPKLAGHGEETDGDVRRRLHFLDHTLHGMIERFEHEYPETRLRDASPSPPLDTANTTDAVAEAIEVSTPSPTRSRSSSPASLASRSDVELPPSFNLFKFGMSPTTPDDWSVVNNHTAFSPPDYALNIPLHSDPGSRRGSETHLASRALSMEEARMHRVGQQFRRQILPPTGITDYLHGVSAADPAEPEADAALRAKLESLGGEELREKINRLGIDETMKELERDKVELRRLELEEPEKFKSFREAQIEAERRGWRLGSPPR